MIHYITYRLLTIDGVGHQPHHQVVSMGMKFDGGQMGKDGRMFAYIEGDKDINEVISCLAAWGAKLLTEKEALEWFDAVIPVGTKLTDPSLSSEINEKVALAARVSVDGRIQKGYEDVKAK